MINPKKSMTLRFGWLLGTMMLFLPGCGGGGSSPTESIFIAGIGDVSWTESGKPSHRFFFVPAQPGVEHSTFDGNEFFGEGGATALTGAYTGREIHFTIQRSAGNVLYQGQFRDANTMDLSSATAGGLTLVRGTS